MTSYPYRMEFQSTLPRRERPSVDIYSLYSFNFNPRSREGSDIPSMSGQTVSPDFNPRSREGSDYQTYRTTRTGFDFKPRSREGSDVRPCMFAGLHHIISIHAPAKGATSAAAIFGRLFRFQSTLPRRERQRFFGISQLAISYFNPRSREGSDSASWITFRPNDISIHAPAKGATRRLDSMQ